MPIYEYRCEKCNKTFELLVRGQQLSATACPHCGATKIQKLFSAFSAPSSQATLGCQDANCQPTSNQHCASCPCCHSRG